MNNIEYTNFVAELALSEEQLEFSKQRLPTDGTLAVALTDLYRAAMRVEALKKAVFKGTRYRRPETAACERRIESFFSNPDNIAKTHAICGLCGEVGEVMEAVASGVPGEVVNECGDATYYNTLVLSTHSSNLQEAVLHNVSKLQARHPDGYKQMAEPSEV